MSNNEEHRTVVIFRNSVVKNEAKSKTAGRPIFDDIELCEIRSAGDRNTVKVFPAHAFHRWVSNPQTQEQEEQTYAQRWNEQYLRFKMNRDQVQDGTPLSELPFLTDAKRRELKALSIHTAESLASLDGQNLKSLGIGGRELKNQAQAYLDNASGSANVTAMAAEIAELRRMLEAQQQAPAGEELATTDAGSLAPAGDNVRDDFVAWGDADLKNFIKTQTGSAPRGNPSHDTLVAMAREVSAPVAA